MRRVSARGHGVAGMVSCGRVDVAKPQKSIRTAWRTLTTAAGLKGFRFHDLRHQAITELAESGAADATMMALAGHVSKQMLEHYSHVRMLAKRQAVDSLGSGLIPGVKSGSQVGGVAS